MGYCNAVTAYIRRTLLAAIPVVLRVSILTFSLLHLLPGDPALVMLGDSGDPPERIAELRMQLGLDDPLVVQYARFLGNLLRGDLGRSIRSNRPVLETTAPCEVSRRGGEESEVARVVRGSMATGLGYAIPGTMPAGGR
jgi:ABC-type microcin C transport system permease subunit YejB